MRSAARGPRSRSWCADLGDTLDVAVVGGGQAGLAAGYYLRRTTRSFVILDAAESAGGAWTRAWPSLRLFSPAQWSSLPGWLLRGGASDYPSRDEVVAYLTEYERRYALPVERPVTVTALRHHGDALLLETSAGPRRARAVIAATGSWSNPVADPLPGLASFAGDVVHSARYPGPASYAGRRVIVLGGGNSGAQIAAELGDDPRVAAMRWVTREPPTFLPPEVDGRYLFEQATLRYKAVQEGRTPDPPRSLGDIVRVAPVQHALEHGTLTAHPMFDRLVERGAVWADGSEWRADTLILATGFRPALAPLQPLGVIQPDGRVDVRGARSVAEPRLWLLGYGDWTGFASATLIGVGRAARDTVREVEELLATGR